MLKKLTIISAVLFTTSSFANNTLSLGEGVNLHAVNGNDDLKALMQDSRALKLPNGNNQLVVSYTAEIKNGGDYELEQTHPSVITFESHDQTIKLTAPKIRTELQIKKFNQTLNWNLNTAQKSIPYAADILPIKGFRLGVNYARELAIFNRSDKPAASSELSSVDPTIISTSTNKQLSNKQLSNAQVRLIVLKSLYQQASDETKQEFLKFLKEN